MSLERVRKLLLECKEKLAGIDNIDTKLVAKPISHILNLSTDKAHLSSSLENGKNCAIAKKFNSIIVWPKQ